MNNQESDYIQHIDGYQDDKMRKYQDKHELDLTDQNEPDYSWFDAVDNPEWFAAVDKDTEYQETRNEQR